MHFKLWRGNCSFSVVLMGKRNFVEVDMSGHNINEDAFLICLTKGDTDFRG